MHICKSKAWGWIHASFLLMMRMAVLLTSLLDVRTLWGECESCCRGMSWSVPVHPFVALEYNCIASVSLFTSNAIRLSRGCSRRSPQCTADDRRALFEIPGAGSDDGCVSKFHDGNGDGGSKKCTEGKTNVEGVSGMWYSDLFSSFMPVSFVPGSG